MKVSKIVKGILVISLIILGICSVIYAQARTETTAPKARFAFFHSAPNTPAVDVVVEEKVLFSNISFNTKTNFELIDAGEYTISINQAGTSNIILGPVRASLKQGRDHILFITGLVDGEPQLTAKLLVKKTRPAFFRFYNTSPDVGSVNVYIDNNLYFQNVEYGQPTKFEKIGFGNLEIVIKQGDTTIVGPIRVNFEPGKAYTIVLVGLFTGKSGGTQLKIEIIEE